MNKNPLTVEAWRGPNLESLHQVDALALDLQGHTLVRFGDTLRGFYPRSAIKMLQATLLLQSGSFEKTGLTLRHLALACASHHGEALHTDLVQEWLKILDLPVETLVCGAHDPADKETAIHLWQSGHRPSKIHNNCSGKHCGLLTSALHLGLDPKTYFQHSHPLQKKLRQLMSQASDFDFESPDWAVDGCGIPTHWADLEVWTRAMVKMLLPENQKLIQAVQQNPFLISGSQGLCSQAIQLTEGRVLLKAGAEGVYLALVPSQSLAVMVKARDGAMRAAKQALLWILQEELHVLTAAHKDQLQPWSEALVKNWAGDVVGELRVRCT